MRKIVVLFFITLSLHVFSQENRIVRDPKVDKRVELLSIVFRLAGNHEYNDKQFKLYTDKIEQHFSPYKKHELIKFAEKLRNEKGISYDAVMSLAVHIDENLNPRTEFEESSLDNRWNKDDAIKFVALLKSFYKETKFEEFYKDNEQMYHEVVISFLPVFDRFDVDWYTSFYGEKPSEKFIIILAIGNGSSNYGAFFQDDENEREIYAFLGAGSTDNSGMIDYEAEINAYYSTLVHEFNHSFVNPLLEKHKELFRVNGEKIYKILENEFSSQAYGSWEIILNEALVRASVVKYLIDHDFEKTMIEGLYYYELDNSFLWIRNLVDELEKYDSQRNIYPTLDSYMEKLAEAYNSFAKIVEQLNQN